MVLEAVSNTPHDTAAFFVAWLFEYLTVPHSIADPVLSWMRVPRPMSPHDKKEEKQGGRPKSAEFNRARFGVKEEKIQEDKARPEDKGVQTEAVTVLTEVEQREQVELLEGQEILDNGDGEICDCNLVMRTSSQ